MKPNPLNYFGMRCVKFPPPQFEYVNIQVSPLRVASVNKWIAIHLSGRYYIGSGIQLDSTNTIIYNTQIGFEKTSEATMFMIACELINK